MTRSMRETGIDSDPKFEAVRPQHGIFISVGGGGERQGCGLIFIFLSFEIRPLRKTST